MDINKFLSSLDNSLHDLFQIVEEPDYSLSQLLKFQRDYHISSIDFYNLYREGSLPVTVDFEKWAHNYEIFLSAHGEIEKLFNDNHTNEGGDKTPPSFC